MDTIAIVGDPAFAFPAWAGHFVRRALTPYDRLILPQAAGPAYEALRAAHGYFWAPAIVYPVSPPTALLLAQYASLVVAFADDVNAHPFTSSVVATARAYGRRLIMQYSSGWAWEEDPEGGAEMPYTRWRWHSFIF